MGLETQLGAETNKLDAQQTCLDPNIAQDE